MNKKIIVNCDNRATQAAVLENGKLVELPVERPLQQRVVSNLYKGIVANVLPGMQAAFIDIGLEKTPFSTWTIFLPPGTVKSRLRPREALKSCSKWVRRSWSRSSRSPSAARAPG